MNPATIALIIQLVEEAIRDEPQVAAALKNLFSKAEPTPADWLELRANILANTYEQYVPATGLPPGQ